MLVLTVEARGEKVHLQFPGGIEAVVSVQQVRGKRVCLGFVAPEEVAIHRESFLRRGEARPAPAAGTEGPS
jgi:sRNA-binding carbon storage regulator CsrA